MSAKETFINNDVANLLAEVDALLVAFPELADDETLRADMLEGETDAFSVLSRLVNIERDADAFSKAIAGRIADLNARRHREDKRKDAMRVLMLRILKATGLQKAKLVEATVSVSKGRESVDVTDVMLLPKWAYSTERKPDKKAIMERLAANKNVPGARRVEGGETVVVRVA